MKTTDLDPASTPMPFDVNHLSISHPHPHPHPHHHSRLLSSFYWRWQCVRWALFIYSVSFALFVKQMSMHKSTVKQWNLCACVCVCVMVSLYCIQNSRSDFIPPYIFSFQSSWTAHPSWQRQECAIKCIHCIHCIHWRWRHIRTHLTSLEQYRIIHAQ